MTQRIARRREDHLSGRPTASEGHDSTADPALDMAELAALLGGLRPASLFHLRTALLAAQTEGVGGSLVIEIPRKSTEPVNVSFVGGKTRLIVET